jgi:hypothetical protein
VSEATQDLIGKLLTPQARRDAIHIAVAPVVAFDYLKPGQPVGLVEGKATSANKKVGVVDPFLTEVVKPGQRFFLFLFPNTITGLRHEWTHPDWDGEKVASEKWLREFAKDNCDFYDEKSTPEQCYAKLLEMAEEGDFCFSGQPDAIYESGPQQELWGHLEVVRGRPFDFGHKSGASFRCSC